MNRKFLALFVLIIILLCCVVLGLGVGLLVFLDSQKILDGSGDFNASNPHEEIELLLAESTLNFFDSLDFETEESLAKSISRQANVFNLANSTFFEKTKFLKYPDFSKENNTFIAHLNFSYDGNQSEFEINSEWAIEYDKEFKKLKPGQKRLDDNQFKEFIESFPEIMVDGEANGDWIDGSVMFDARLIDGELYLKLNSSQSGSLGLGDLAQNEFLKIDLKENIKRSLIEGSENNNLIDGAEIDFFYEDEVISNINKNKEQIKNILLRIFKDAYLFDDVEKYQNNKYPLADECYKANLEVGGLKKSFENHGRELFKYLTTSSKESDLAFKQALDQLEDMQEFFDENNLLVEICVNDNKNFSALNIFLTMKNGEIIELEYYLKTLNSDKRIVKPESYVDVTKYLTNDSGSINIFYLNNLLSSFDTSKSTDSLISEPQVGDNYRNDDINWDEYLEEVNKILEDYEKNKIDDQEYLRRFDELNLRYGV